MNREALLTDTDVLRQVRQLTFNPLGSLTARSLVRALNHFDAGDLREAALLFEAIAERDDVLPGVKAKREMAVSQMECAVEVSGESTDEAEEHKRVLEEFWGNITAVNAVDRDERGGFKMLVKQMMRAVSFKWSVHHIVWEPRADGTLRALFQAMPLWLFENKEGALRYRADIYGYEGEVMPRDRWMVTRGQGLMVPCSIGYFFKRAALNDLAIYAGKFAVPPVVGATSAAKGSPEGEAMRAGVAGFVSDMNAVLYGVEDPSKVPIHLIEPKSTASSLPMPAITERVDRTFSTLYRGGDLSTMSSKDGQGQGASLQDKESDILKGDDADTIEETIAQVSRMVIEWYFGAGVDPLAVVRLRDAEAKADGSLLEAALKLADRGVHVDVNELARRLEVPLADADAQALAPGSTGPSVRAENADTGSRAALTDELIFRNAAQRNMDAALLADLEPVLILIDQASQAPDTEARDTLLAEAKAAFDLLELGEMTASYEDILSSALVNGYGNPTPEADPALAPNSAPGFFRRLVRRLGSSKK